MTPNTIQRPVHSLYFLHIPKTAGTSIRYWLEDWFGRDEWLPCHILDDVRQRSRQSINSYRLFSGHFGWEILNLLDHRPPVITWLREPIKRLVSNYDFIRNSYDELVAIALQNGQQGWIEHYERCQQMTLIELCESDFFLGFDDNLQTRYLAGVFPRPDRLLLDREILRQAKQNLASLDFVGICEWMAASIDALCYHFGCPTRPLTQRLNTASQVDGATRTQLSDDMRQSIARLESFDIELYAFAQELFADRFLDIARRAGRIGLRRDRLPGMLAEYQADGLAEPIRHWINRQVDRRRPIDSCAQQLNIDFNDADFLSGWYPRTRLPSGQSIRWAGPEKNASLFVPLAAGQTYQLSFVIRYLLSWDTLQTMRIVLGDRQFPVTWETHTDDFAGKRQYRVSATVETDATGPQRGWRELRIETDGTLKAFEHDPSMLASFATDGFQIQAVAAVADDSDSMAAA